MNTQRCVEKLAVVAATNPTFLKRIKNIETIEEFANLTSEFASLNAMDITPSSIAEVLKMDTHNEVAVGDAQLEKAAGFGYGYYACTDNSNFTAQRSSACLPCR